jgi:two-component system sensor histidine kinase MprB
MPLRRRLTIATTAAVAVVVALACVVAYLAVRDELMNQVDEQLTAQVKMPRPRDGLPPREGFRALSARRGGPTPYIQLVDSTGTVATFGSEDAHLPVDAKTRAVAAGSDEQFFSTVHMKSAHVRILTAPLPDRPGIAVEVGRSLDSIDKVLKRMRLILLLVILCGVALAVGLARLISRSIVRPIVNVTEAARHIAATEDLGRRIEVTSQDEVGELAQHFNAMLDTLAGSIDAQRQLVADASHELRTPITSLRTNIEVLAESDELPPDERARLLADVEEQTAELGALVGDLIELARGDEPVRETEDVRLDELVEEAVARARRHAPRVRFEAAIEPAVVEGTRERLARAVNNLLDNAATHSSPGGVVEVAVGASGLRVRDHGTGIAEEDLPHLFDRFYRGATARQRPGSGLGLAIVRQVAEQHGGSVRATNAPGGGAEFMLELPAAAVVPSGLWS